jgi:type IV pilus assembly protein PilW
MKSNQGFTLVELMVALGLGLLLTAAAIQLFITGSITFNSQRNAADVQDGSLFGLGLINQQLRKTNSGNTSIIGAGGGLNGIVFNSSSVTSTAITNFPVTSEDTGTASTVDGKSDQLVIQYEALQDGMHDCEGNNVAKNSVVVERYFLRADSTSTETPKALALACAAFLTTDLSTVTTSQGSILINRADDMRLLLGTSTPAGLWRYYDISDYLALTSRPTIRTVRIGTLIRSSVADATAKKLPPPVFQLLDQNITISNPSDGYMRRVFTTTVSFRNSLGDGV